MEFSIINYLYSLIWGEPQSQTEDIGEDPLVDYEQIIKNYRLEEEYKRKKRKQDIIDYYKYGHF